MVELLGILGLCALGASYWQIRRQSEFARQWLERYCRKQQFQLLSVYRYRYQWQKGRLIAQFRFEFSHDGLQQDEGKLWLQQLTVLDVCVPVLRESPSMH